MKRKVHLVHMNPIGIGEQFDTVMADGESAVDVLDFLSTAAHRNGLTLSTLRRMLQRNPTMTIKGSMGGFALEVTGLDPDALESAVTLGIIDILEVDDENTPEGNENLQ